MDNIRKISRNQVRVTLTAGELMLWGEMVAYIGSKGELYPDELISRITTQINEALQEVTGKFEN